MFLAISISGCALIGKKSGKGTSHSTGWSYNDPETGNIPYESGYRQETGPGLVFIEGGTFTMGRVEQDVMYRWDNHPRRITVASFYMDETEVSNQDYREYVHWISRVYPTDKAKIEEALPDTLQWLEELAYNDPYVRNYLRHPAYSDYPVVGVSWLQANAYCSWRTDRVNEQILVNRGIITHDNAQSGQNVFTTDTYLAGLYQGADGKKPLEDNQGGTRRPRWEDGILLPSYRLPTEAEWEFAAYGLIGNSEGELLTDRRIYPWNGTYLREDLKKDKGRLKANFTRGRGDLMGMAGSLNDNADISAPVSSYQPNDYGLYCMSGNVNEWVMDVFRPLSFMDIDEFQPLRGSIFTIYKRDESGNLVRDQYGELIKDTLADYRNYRDGDYQSLVIEGNDWNTLRDTTRDVTISTKKMYIQDETPGAITSLIGDDVRVYKGGSWKDRPYWLNPGTRRYLEQYKSKNDLGFRCAMTRVGSPKGF